MQKSKYLPGHIVKVNGSFLGYPDDSIGFVYKVSTEAGKDQLAYVILENKADIGGFSLEEQNEMLEMVYDSGYRYKFKNTEQLHKDFDLFTNGFRAANALTIIKLCLKH